ncbi:MAG: hypothetical protein FJW79_05015 [Actinobacteria bacterium]|nr:hypothetical protein [Actinomycetota bacterium]
MTVDPSGGPTKPPSVLRRFFAGLGLILGTVVRPVAVALVVIPYIVAYVLGRIGLVLVLCMFALVLVSPFLVWWSVLSSSDWLREWYLPPDLGGVWEAALYVLRVLLITVALLAGVAIAGTAIARMWANISGSSLMAKVRDSRVWRWFEDYLPWNWFED